MTTNTFTTMQDFFKTTTATTMDMFKALPKTPEETKAVFEKVQAVFKAEGENAQGMWATYFKAAKGDATPNEIALANARATELLKTTVFAGMVAMPGTIFILPALVAKAKEHNIDLVPKSVSANFNI